MIMIPKVISLYYQLKDFNPPFFSDFIFPFHLDHMFSCHLVMFDSWGVIAEDPGYRSFCEKGEEGAGGGGGGGLRG